MVLIVKVDNTIAEQSDREVFNDLDWLQGQVGGMIEYLPLDPPVMVNDQTYDSMMLNEEGKLAQLPLNPRATEIAISGGLRDDYIAGDVVLFNDGDID